MKTATEFFTEFQAAQFAKTSIEIPVLDWTEEFVECNVSDSCDLMDKVAQQILGDTYMKSFSTATIWDDVAIALGFAGFEFSDDT